MSLSLTPQDAWQPLPESAWNAATARHLLRRAGWTARRIDVDRAVSEGLTRTLDRLFPSESTETDRFPMPTMLARFEQTTLSRQRETARLTGDERLRAQREVQDRMRVGLQELSIKWLEHAARPEASAVAKWTLFLADVYVVSAEKVRNPAAVYRHFDILATHGLGPAPALTKAVSRSAAMLFYLDLGQSQLRAPNENFARELFELFLLGEGNYTEADIKESARAFTGYRSNADGTFRFDERIHDKGPKTVFGETGPLRGDDVIDLAYRQPAAATFLPREVARYYLSETPLPEDYVASLGAIWKERGFDLGTLARVFFGSQLFYAPEFRGSMIKSPIQFYLGLVQDMDLHIAPLPRFTLTPLRQMGQLLFHPPNVRGWVGGRQWINSATIAARRQLVELLFSPLDERTLNGDELFELVAARSNGFNRFTVSDEPLAPLSKLNPGEAAVALTRTFLAADEGTVNAADDLLRDFLAASASDDTQRLRRLRRAAVTLMQSPGYQLC